MSGRTVRKTIHYCWLILAVAWAVPVLTKADNSCPDSAQQFWTAFRQAVLVTDSTALAKMTHFPLEVRGTLDDSPRRKIGQADFIKILPQLLVADPGMNPEHSSMKHYIRQVETIPGEACNQSGNQFWIGSWVFSKQDNHWLLTQAFIEE